MWSWRLPEETIIIRLIRPAAQQASDIHHIRIIIRNQSHSTLEVAMQAYSRLPNQTMQSKISSSLLLSSLLPRVYRGASKKLLNIALPKRSNNRYLHTHKGLRSSSMRMPRQLLMVLIHQWWRAAAFHSLLIQWYYHSSTLHLTPTWMLKPTSNNRIFRWISMTCKCHTWDLNRLAMHLAF